MTSERQIVEEVAHIRAKQRRILDLQWSADGKTLASAGSDGTVKLWSLHQADPGDTRYPQGSEDEFQQSSFLIAIIILEHPSSSQNAKKSACGKSGGSKGLYWRPKTQQEHSSRILVMHHEHS